MSGFDVVRVRAGIAAHGWMVMAISDQGCECCSGKPVASGHDPFLYTAGLTAVGLPELVLVLAGRNSMKWIRSGHRLLNAVAGLASAGLAAGEPLVAGGSYVTGGRTVDVAVGPPFGDRVRPGVAVQLYGDRVSWLEVSPRW